MADDEVAHGAKPDNRKMAAGFAAKLACSGVFVSGRTLEDVVRDDIQRAWPSTRDMAYALDINGQTVTATKRGVSVTALHRPGVGAVLVVDTDLETLRRQTGGLTPARTLTSGGLRNGVVLPGGKVDLITCLGGRDARKSNLGEADAA